MISKPPDHCPECGCLLTQSHRSSRHHRRLFALIHAAFNQWPEQNEFQPESAEHLRAWLLVKAGHRETREIPVQLAHDHPGLATLARLAIEAAFREAGAFAFINPNGNGVVSIYRPKSIAWHQLDQKKFAPIADAVEQIIENAIGVKADQLLKEKAA